MLHGRLVHVCKTLTDLQILDCELHQNAFGGRALPGPVGGAIALPQTVFEKTCATTQKNVKSCFLKSEKNVKNVKKRRPTAYVQFHRPLNHSAFNAQLPKLSTCTGKSPTSHTLLRNADTRN